MNRRASGITGIIASIVLFAGDMLLYGHFGGAGDFSEGVKEVASNASLGRLFAGGILGPIGALLYIVGFRHVYLSFRQAYELWAKIVFSGLTAMIVIGGTYHSLWTVRMLLFKYGVTDIQSLQSFTDAINSYSSFVYLVSSIPGYVALPLLFIVVLTGKTYYPRWTVIVNPGLLYLFSFNLTDLPAPLGVVIMGGYINLMYFVFFMFSVITTWRADTRT